MTEEIINGIDVSGCKFYIQDYQRANNIEGRYEHCKDVCDLTGDNYFYCKMNENCYYKQLKRLEAENAKLKEEIKALEKKKNKRITFLKQMVKKLNHEKACAWGMLVPIPYSYYDVYLWGAEAFGKDYVEKARKAESEV